MPFSIQTHPMAVSETDLVGIGNKYLFTPPEDRCWKIPVLYNELRRLRGESFQRFIHADYGLDIFERETKLILDSIIPSDYIFTGEGGTWVWPYDEDESGDVEDESGDVEDEGMPFGEFMSVLGTAQ